MRRSFWARHVDYASLKLDPGKSLLVSVSLLGPGLSRVFVWHDVSGEVRVEARNGPNGGQFKIEDFPGSPEGHCDVEISRTEPDRELRDMLAAMFWRRFTFGGVSELLEDRSFLHRLDQTLSDLTESMEATAISTFEELLQKRR